MKSTAFILIFLWVTNLLLSQNYKLEIIPDALISEPINAMFFENETLGWFATSSGLYKYSNDKFSLITDTVNKELFRLNAITKAADGALWLGNYTGSIIKMEEGKIVKTLTAQDYKSAPDLINSITVFRNIVWAATSGKIIKHNNYTNKTEVIEAPENATIYTVHIDSTETAWVGTSLGMYFLQKKNKWKHFTGFTKTYLISSNKADSWALGKSSENTLLLMYKLNYDLMIFFVSVDKSRWEPMQFHYSDSKIRFYDIAYDFKGNIWFATDKGLLKYNPITGIAVAISPTEFKDFSKESFNKIAIQNNRTIWAQSNSGFLYRITEN